MNMTRTIEPDDVINVDFDNTITVDNVRYWDGERPEVDEAVATAVREHYYQGGTVIVWTARPWSEAGRICGHLIEWGIPFHGIRCAKGSGDHYIDDKAIRPEDFAADGA